MSAARALAIAVLGVGRVALAEPCASEAAAHARAPDDVAATRALAACDERADRRGSAWALYRGLGDAAAATRAAAHAPTLALALEPADAAATARVFVGAIDARAALTAPIPLDVGEVAIAASAPGYATWRQTLTVKPGDPPRALTIRLARATEVGKLDPGDPDEPDAIRAHAQPAPPVRDGAAPRGAIAVGVDAAFLFAGVGTRALVRAGYAYRRGVELDALVGVRAVGGAIDQLGATTTTRAIGGGVAARAFVPVGTLCRPFGELAVTGWSHGAPAEAIGAGVACAEGALQLALALEHDFGGYATTAIVVGLGGRFVQ